LSGFLTAIGQQLAQRWATVLVLPGLVFIAIAMAGHALGQTRSYDVPELVRSAQKLATQFDGRPVAAVLAVGGIALAAIAVALLAQGVGTAARSLWLVYRVPWPFSAVVEFLVDKRGKAWKCASTKYDEARRPPAPADDVQLAKLADKRNRIALAPPIRPTWIGDRMASASTRVYSQYHLSLDFAWPRLWLVLPDLVRAEVKDARDSFDHASTLQGWGLLYMALGIEWWPAAVAGLFTVVLAWQRGRASMGTLADLVEAAFDLYAVSLATSLGFTQPGAPDQEPGGGWQAPRTEGWAAIDDWIRKGS
jgi:hypothetical protein